MTAPRSHHLANTAWGLALLALLFVPLSARIVVIGAPQRTSREDLRAAAKAVTANPTETEALRARGFDVKVSDGNLLTSDLAPTPLGVTFIWSDGPVKASRGFTAPAPVIFENSIVSRPPAKPVAAAPKTLATTLTRAAWGPGGLTIGYTVAEPGPVTVRAYGPNGKTLGSWHWHESQAGARERSLAVRADALRGGPVWIRWSQGRVSAVRRLGPAEAR